MLFCYSGDDSLLINNVFFVTEFSMVTLLPQAALSAAAGLSNVHTLLQSAAQPAFPLTFQQSVINIRLGTSLSFHLYIRKE